MSFVRRRIDQDIDISTLREMRYEGMTNKQIAEAIGCSTSSVYRLIGKMSADVQHAAEQNRPSPVRPKPVQEPLFIGEPAPLPVRVEKVEVSEPVPEPKPTEELKPDTVSTLRVIREVRILDLEGVLCTYHIDPRSGDVEFGGDIIRGLLDRQSLNTFIAELEEVRKILENG